MKFTSVILSIVLFISCTYAASTCLGTASLSARASSGSSWTDGVNNFQIYDISLGNSGSCPLDAFNLQFTFSSGSLITESWNMLLNGGTGSAWIVNSTTLSVTGAHILAPGISSISVGFVLRFPLNLASATASVKVLKTQCSSCVNGPSSAPTSSAPTSAPTMSAPTAAPSSSPSGTCSASATLVARQSAFWNDGVNNYQIFDVTINNIGSCDMNSVGLQFTFSSGASINSSWNMLNDGTYWLVGTSTLNIASGPFLTAGETTAAVVGFILSYPMTTSYSLSASVNVYGSACASSCSA